MRALVNDEPEAKTWDTERMFTFRAADSQGHRSSANILLQRMYAWRGYETKPMPLAESSDRITLVAVDQGETVGTMTVGFDGPTGLHVDELFPQEVALLRQAGRTLSEFTKLAMDSVVQSKRVLASLFHLAYMYAHRVKGCDTLLIEVNPRHVRYYQRMLGFEALGPERLNKRVNAPAVLLRLDFAHASEQIGKFGGQGDACETERSLYPYFFSAREEAGIIGRLTGTSVQTGSHPSRHTPG